MDMTYQNVTEPQATDITQKVIAYTQEL